MVEGQRKAVEEEDMLGWNRTCAVLAQIHNANLDPKEDSPINPLKFCPYVDLSGFGSASPPTAKECEMLARAFPGKPN